jgi:hypothetical protein
VFAPLWLVGVAMFAAEPNPAVTRKTTDYVPDVAALAAPASSELRELVERFRTDRGEIERFYSIRGSETRERRLREFLAAWQTRLAEVKFDALGGEGRIDATLLRGELAHELRLRDRDEQRTREMAPVLPFAAEIAALEEKRRFMEPLDPRASAMALDQIRNSLVRAREGLEAGLKKPSEKPDTPVSAKAVAKVAPITVTKVVAARAVRRLDELRDTLKEWFEIFDGYDPTFSWWNREPYKQLTEAMTDYRKFLREKVVGIDPKAKEEPIIGDPSWNTR